MRHLLLVALLAGCSTAPSAEALRGLGDVIVSNAVNYSDPRFTPLAKSVSLANANALTKIYMDLTGDPLPLELTLKVYTLSAQRDEHLRAAVAPVTSEAAE